MRRNERAITDHSEILQVIRRCDTCRLAFHGDEHPYIVPMSFGFEDTGGALTLYFHCAVSGRKLELMARDARVAFEMDAGHRLVMHGENACSCTMEYESVMGTGTLAFVPDSEKEAALRRVMEHYYPGNTFPFEPRALPKTAVLRLSVDSLSAKRSPAPL